MRVNSNTKNKTYLRINQFHHGLLQVLQIDGVFGGSPSYYIVLVIVITPQRGKLLRVGKLDIDPVFLHDALDTTSTDTDNPFVVRLWDVE